MWKTGVCYTQYLTVKDLWICACPRVNQPTNQLTKKKERKKKKKKGTQPKNNRCFVPASLVRREVQ